MVVRNLTIISVAICALAASCGSEATTDPGDVGQRAHDTTNVRQATPDPGDIVFVLPSHLPQGWSLGHATQRLETVDGPDGDPVEFSDYTIVWQPDRFVGTTRNDSTRSDEGPQFWINVGSAYYNQLFEAEVLRSNVETAEVTSEDGLLEIEFRVGCCLVRFGGRDVGEEDLRRVASSISVMSQGPWRSALGDRLYVDDQRGT